jgi:hypothetical protein
METDLRFDLDSSFGLKFDYNPYYSNFNISVHEENQNLFLQRT